MWKGLGIGGWSGASLLATLGDTQGPKPKRPLSGSHERLFHNSLANGTYRIGGKRGERRAARRRGEISARQQRLGLVGMQREARASVR